MAPEVNELDVGELIYRAANEAEGQRYESSVAFSLLAIAKMLQGVIGDRGTVIDVRADVRQGGL